MAKNILLLLAISLMLSCSQRKNKSDDIQFRIDKSLLGELFQDTSTRITIQIPIGWVAIQEKRILFQDFELKLITLVNHSVKDSIK